MKTWFFLNFLISNVFGFSAISENADLARNRLNDALKSLSGKLTLSPEIEIIEPKDPTALLLQTPAVQALSDQVRTAAKANAAWLSGTTSEIQTFCEEQEEARGNFPAPIPIIYCGEDQAEWKELADAGVSGVMLQCKISSLDDLKSTELKTQSEQALALGLQPVPEIILETSTACTWTDESYMENLLSTLTSIIEQEPASIILTIRDDNASTGGEEGGELAQLPPVPKSISKKIPVLGSVSVIAGGNRIGTETKRWKEAGYTGNILRKTCLPPSFTNDLDLVGRFWSSCIGELKSTKSKNFQFLTRNYMDKVAPLEWQKYQKSVIDSGALGSSEDGVSINEGNGDYQGF